MKEILLAAGIFIMVCFHAIYLDSRYPQDLGLLPEGLPGLAEAQKALIEAGKIYLELKALIDHKISK